jgi:hypothetical protein
VQIAFEAGLVGLIRTVVRGRDREGKGKRDYHKQKGCRKKNDDVQRKRSPPKAF